MHRRLRPHSSGCGRERACYCCDGGLEDPAAVRHCRPRTHFTAKAIPTVGIEMEPVVADPQRMSTVQMADANQWNLAILCQVAEREATVAGLEAAAAELALRQEANSAAAAQLTARSEAVAAEAQAAKDAAEVTRPDKHLLQISWVGASGYSQLGFPLTSHILAGLNLRYQPVLHSVSQLPCLFERPPSFLTGARQL